MQRQTYTVEELMLNDSFLSYCLEKQAPEKEFWVRMLSCGYYNNGWQAESSRNIFSYIKV